MENPKRSFTGGCDGSQSGCFLLSSLYSLPLFNNSVCLKHFKRKKKKKNGEADAEEHKR